MERNRFNLLDGFEIRGIWWDSQSPDLEIAGVLTYTPGKSIRLELIGTFTKLESGPLEFEHSPAAIHGYSEDGKRISLFNGHRINQIMRFGGISTDVYACYLMIVGNHFASEDDVSISRLYLELYGLRDWYNLHAFNVNYTRKADNYKLVNYSLNYRPKKPTRIYCKKIRTWISIERDFRENNDRITNLELQSDVYFKIQPQNEKGIKWYKGIAQDIERLLTVLIGEPIYPIHLTGIQEYVDDETGKKEPRELHILFLRTSTANYREIKWREVLVPYRKVEGNLKRIFNAWLGTDGELANSHNLFFGALHNRYLYEESIFLALMQAIESYHRVKQSGAYMDSDQYGKLASKIVDAFPAEIPNSLRDSLRNRILYGNQFSLRKRLASIFRSIGLDLSLLVTRNSSVFVKRVIDTRNYLTHLDESTKGDAIDRDQLFYGSFRLRLLISILLLRDAGVDDSTIVECIRDNSRLTNMLSTFDFETE
jgi:hypothetical protein